MYKVSVPVMNVNFAENTDRERAVEMLKKMKAERIFLAFEADTLDGEEKEKELKALKDNLAFLKDKGFEIGVWLWTFLTRKESKFTRMKSPQGKVSNELACPSDKNYCRLMHSFLKEVSAEPIDIIMFDDDFRYGFIDIGFGCLCKNHYKKICEILGEKPDRKALEYAIMNGGKNKYRDAFIKANGYFLEEFARSCRESVDSVDHSKRMGFCSCISSWDIDGTTPDRISQLLAGNTKPFYRLIGAPYWAALKAWGNTLGYVIEHERALMQRRENKAIEIFSEGDTYPRPRYATPASYLECFDTALRADGSSDGILKYAFDYTSDLEYEKGYYDSHIRNMPYYKRIAQLFDGKEAIGLRVADNMEKFSTTEMPMLEDNPGFIQDASFNRASRLAVSSSIPTVYGSGGCATIAFGEDVRLLSGEEIGSGVILDYTAAKILKEKGIDVGFFCENGVVNAGKKEYFESGRQIELLSDIKLHKLDISEKAHILSFSGKEEKIPVCYTYENESGIRFAVFTFDGYTADDGIFRAYARQSQMLECIKFINPEGIPVSCVGNPDLYILAKQKNDKISVGLWNLSADKIYSPEVEFAWKVELLRAFCPEGKAKGKSDGNKIILENIEPYSSLIFEVNK